MKRIFIVAALAIFSSAAHAQRVNVTLEEWKITLSKDTVPAGAVTFNVTNGGSMTHGFHITGDNNFDKGTRDLPKGEAASLKLTLKPGTYEIFCPLAEGTHKTAGMHRTFVVTAATTAPAKKKP